MPYTEGICGRIGRFYLVLLVAVVLAASMAPKANAQFQFTWTGGTISGQSVVVSIVFNATETFGGSGIYNINSLISGSITDKTPDGENLDAMVNGFTTETIGGFTPRSQFFLPAGGTGSAGTSGHYAAASGSQIGGFRIETNLATNPDFLFYANVGLDEVARAASGNVLLAVTSTSTGTHTITQVPGPLAGAGMLSYLAVLLMGLVWRWQGKRRAGAVPAIGPVHSA